MMLCFHQQSLVQLLALLLFVVDVLSVVQSEPLTEVERVEEYHKRNYEWPIKEFVPNSPGWKKLMESRLEQVMHLEQSGFRYEGFMQTMPSALLVNNFTQYGFAVARAPEELTKEMQDFVHSSLESNRYRYERKIQVIDGPPAIFIDNVKLVNKAMFELQPYVEAWSGQAVTPNNAYGFRLYRNESALHMHTDKIQTHILSFIYHIDSSDDAEPWPIYIEDCAEGQTYEVILTPGDILFYESTKCFHGRPKPFNGSWYTSIFVHYYPVGWQNTDHYREIHYSIPPEWDQTPEDSSDESKLEMAGTSMKEPDCPNNWCRTTNAIKWSGPGEEGYYITPDLKKHALNIENSPSYFGMGKGPMEEEDEEL